MNQRWTVLLLAAALTSGCGSDSASMPYPKVGDSATPSQSQTHAESQLRFQASPVGKIVLKWNTQQLYEKAGLPDLTGETLLGYVPDDFPRELPETTYAIHAGPGEEQGLYLDRFPEDGRAVRAKLTRVDADFNPVGDPPIVSELDGDPRSEKDALLKMPFRAAVRLPERTDALYTLATELLEADGSVSDAVVSVVYVPGPIVNAFLATDKDVYRAGEQMELKVVNNGPTNLSFGRMYLIEKQDGDAWTPINGESVWTLEGYSLTPEGRSEQPVKLDGLKPGAYRISKDVDADHADFGVTLSKTFRIE